MPAERMLPSAEAADLLALTRDLATAELAPVASEYEAASRFPRDKFRLLGKSGLLGLPYPERWGGSALSYEVYLQVLEELAAAWMTVAVGLSVHTMSCYPLAAFGTDEQPCISDQIRLVESHPDAVDSARYCSHRKCLLRAVGNVDSTPSFSQHRRHFCWMRDYLISTLIGGCGLSRVNLGQTCLCGSG